jgi:hypothetical protein
MKRRIRIAECNVYTGSISIMLLYKLSFIYYILYLKIVHYSILMLRQDTFACLRLNERIFGAILL